MGRHLSPRYCQVILFSGYLVLTAVNLSQPVHVQSVFSWAPKVGRKCERKNWYACGSVGRSEAVYGHVITKFSGMGRFTYRWCSAGALRVRKNFAMNFKCFLNEK